MDPLSGSIQIALLGQYLALQDRFHRLHRKYRQKAEGWEKGRRVDHLTVESTLLELQEEFGFTSPAAVKRAAISGGVARAALMEMNARYPIRSRPDVGDPSNSFVQAFKRAREIIRTVRLDPFTVGYAEAPVPSPREEELQRLPKEDVARITNRVARDVALKRLAERAVEQTTRRIALDAYRELRPALDIYVKTHRPGVR